jgi:hypothetical protein
MESGEFEEWIDEDIADGGTDTSLWTTLRVSVRHFLEYKLIADLILGMTIFLCVVIFTQLAMPSEDIMKELNPETGLKEMTVTGLIFYIINYFLLTFFVIEIGLKLFAYGHIFLMSVINVIDSIVVIVSYVFHVMDLDVKFVGLLRILRLIKVISELKR